MRNRAILCIITSTVCMDAVEAFAQSPTVGTIESDRVSRHCADAKLDTNPAAPCSDDVIRERVQVTAPAPDTHPIQATASGIPFSGTSLTDQLPPVTRPLPPLDRGLPLPDPNK